MVRAFATLLFISTVVMGAEPACPRTVPAEVKLFLATRSGKGQQGIAEDSVDAWIFCDSAPAGAGIAVSIMSTNPDLLSANASGAKVAWAESDSASLAPQLRATASTSRPGKESRVQKPWIELATQTSSASVPVTITFTNQPFAHASRSALLFTGSGGGLADQKVALSFPNARSPLPYTTAVANAKWLSVQPASGAGPGQLTVHVDMAGLEAGSYWGTIQVKTPGAINGTLEIPVRLVVGAAKQP